MNATRFEGYGGSWKKYPDSRTVVVCLKAGKLGLGLRLVECSPGVHEALGSTSSIAKWDTHLQSQYLGGGGYRLRSLKRKAWATQDFGSKQTNT